MINKEARHLETKIRIFEDMLLRTKNFGQVELIHSELMKMRARLQKMQYEKIGS